MTVAFTFPGQGSQAVGMGAELAGAFAAAREVFGEVDEALQQNLTQLMFEGPEDELRLTENAQPALMALSLAVLRVLEREVGLDLARSAQFVAGHSLGEYSALAAAGSFSLAETAKLLKTRGQAMQKAVPVGNGAMAALLGLEMAAVLEIVAVAAQGDICTVANDNADGQVVVSGTTAAVARAIDLAKEKGAKRTVLLPVSAPFHCALMQPAADVMREALANVTINPPVVPLVANVTAAVVTDPEQIRALLVQQVTAMVRWREVVLYMAERGVETLYEIGAGKVLTGLVRRINRDIRAVAIATPRDVEAFAGSP